MHVLHGPAHSYRRADGDSDEARCATYLQQYDDVEGLGRVQRQSQHGLDLVRANLWLPGRVPMGSAAEVILPVRAWITRACRIRCPSPSLLVSRSFDRSLGGHVALRCRIYLRICTSKAMIGLPGDLADQPVGPQNSISSQNQQLAGTSTGRRSHVFWFFSLGSVPFSVPDMTWDWSSLCPRTEINRDSGA